MEMEHGMKSGLGVDFGGAENAPAKGVGAGAAAEPAPAAAHAAAPAPAPVGADAEDGAGGSALSHRYSAEQVVCVECEHVREMRGETDEVVRRTRSEAAENAVLNAVRSGGVEPDWFVERWLEKESVLVACAVFEDVGKCASFRKAVNDWVNKVRERGDAVPVRLRSDAALERAVAEHFSAEWKRMRSEQMGRYAKVLADAKASGKWNGRVVVGQYSDDAADAKAAFGKLCEELNEAFPHDEFGEGGVVYSGYWDRVGDAEVARFSFGFPDAEAMMAAQDAMDRAGARFYDPLTEDGIEGVELEMAALVIAKMQTEENARKAREELAEKAAEKMESGVEKGVADKAAEAMA